METYLEDLDRALLAERPWTIIRLHLAENGAGEPIRPVTAGQGRMIRIPLPVARRPPRLPQAQPPRKAGKLRKRTRDRVVGNALLRHLPCLRVLRKLSARVRELEAVGAGAAMQRVLATYAVDLIVMHYVGGWDSNRVIDVALRHGVPYTIINHYCNDRLNHFSIWAQSREAAGVGGVNADNVPVQERARFIFLGDGIDLSLYRRDPNTLGEDKEPVIFTPARITPAKGQRDLVLACAELRRQGVRFRIALAGRVDNEDYWREVRHTIAAAGLEPQTTFLGELQPNELKTAYSRAAVMALPSYHDEGLPRVLLEAQAMQVPPIAYRSGGISEAVVPPAAGCLVSAGDLAGLTARLQELLSAPDRRRRMGAAGRAHVERSFSLEALASRHESFYRRAILGST
jgi:glycosyltransferase involved in cell wall biosynthesis